MFYCPACGAWIVETAMSKALGVEAGKLEHSLAEHHPELAALVGLGAPIAIFFFVAWAAPKAYRWLK
jgi:hypothetical protein